MLNTAVQLETLNSEVINYIRKLEADNQQLKIYQNKYYSLKEQYDALMYKKYVRSAEELKDEGQQPLFNEECNPTDALGQETAPLDESAKLEVKAHTRTKSGRKPLDPNLRRVEEIIDIPEEEKTCACGSQMTKIGEETSEKLEIIPQSIYVTKTIRPKYACRSCEGTANLGFEDEDEPAVKIAPVLPVIIPRSIASASLLSYIMIHKYQDHLPFYRQELQFERIGVTISRQDMSNWQRQIYEKLLPLFNLLEELIKTGPVMRMDETTIQVMGEEGRSDIKKSCMWLTRGGLPDNPIVLFRYRQTKGAYHAISFLEGFKGYLQTDGSESYDAAVAGLPDIVHVGCFAHARRKFFDASKAVKTPRSAEEGIKHIRKLYEIENNLRELKLSEDVFIAERKELALPVLLDFHKWLNKRANEVLPSSQLGKAVGYTLKQWSKLIAYLESPHLTPDNNASENAIRPFVLGRKNWLFNKSPKGADSSCAMYSLIETAKLNGIEPLKYLHELFIKAPYAVSTQDWEKLLPWNILKT
jgi:transposase